MEETELYNNNLKVLKVSNELDDEELERGTKHISCLYPEILAIIFSLLGGDKQILPSKIK